MVDNYFHLYIKVRRRNLPPAPDFFVASLLIDNLNSQIIMGISINTNKTMHLLIMDSLREL